ncbi:MAG TPA: hypothetical protein DDW67_02350 [Elusimicrobia bacterium]|nr:hypothetical protein [Elusimicrobiota bacterium]
MLSPQPGPGRRIVSKILIAEDDDSLRTLLEVNFSARKHMVLAVADGEKALDAYKHFNPDGVILDIMLPGILGWDVCRAIRNTAGRNLPIILMSALYNKLEFRLDAQKAGATDVVAKPFDINEFAAYFEKLLKAVPAPSAGVQNAANPKLSATSMKYSTEKKVVIYFPDGAVINGITSALNPGGAGFNMTVAGGNKRMYVSYAAVLRVEVVDEF